MYIGQLKTTLDNSGGTSGVNRVSHAYFSSIYIYNYMEDTRTQPLACTCSEIVGASLSKPHTSVTARPEGSRIVLHLVTITNDHFLLVETHGAHNRSWDDSYQGLT